MGGGQVGAALPALLLTNMEGPVGHCVEDSDHKQHGPRGLTLNEREHTKKKTVGCTITNVTNTGRRFTTSKSLGRASQGTREMQEC